MGKSELSLSEESPSPERRMEAEKEDVSFSDGSESIHASLSLSSAPSPGGQSGKLVEGGTSEAGGSVSRSPGGKSAEDVEALAVWLGVREVEVGDVGTSGTGDRVMDLASSGEGVCASTTGCSVL